MLYIILHQTGGVGGWGGGGGVGYCAAHFVHRAPGGGALCVLSPVSPPPRIQALHRDMQVHHRCPVPGFSSGHNRPGRSFLAAAGTRGFGLFWGSGC